MIKIVMCMTRLPHLTLEEFHRYWLEEHAPLVKEAAAALRIRRYRQGHYFSDPRIAPPIAARACGVGAFDGVAELWWDSLEDIVAAGATPEGRRHGRRLLEDEKKFIDLGRSSLFYTTEHEIVAAESIHSRD